MVENVSTQINHQTGAKATNDRRAQKPAMEPVVIAKSFAAGGVAGCFAKTTIAPLDRTKILLQVHRENYSHLSIVGALRRTYQTEGIKGLYRGNGVMMIRIFPYAGTQFLAHENYKRILHTKFGNDSHFARLSAGSLAGVTAVLVTYPLDFARARLAYQTKDDKLYAGLLDVFRKVRKNEGGILRLWTGITPSILGMIPYAGISFYTYESLKRYILSHSKKFTYFTRPRKSHPEEIVLKKRTSLIIGAVAGMLAQTFSYPLDVARRRMQLSRVLPNSEKYRNIYSTLAFVYKEHGLVRGLYRGLSINYVRIIPQVSVSFTVYEAMRQILNLQTGIKISTG